MEKIKKMLAAILGNFPVAVVKLRYLMRFKRLPNLKNPHNLNENILYQKLYHIRNSGLNRPENLESMIEYARILAKPFPQVRVDFYDIEGKIYFGELTFTSLGGMMNYFTQEALNDMGEKIDLSYSRL